jgi:hypothetical protein
MPQGAITSMCPVKEHPYSISNFCTVIKCVEDNVEELV